MDTIPEATTAGAAKPFDKDYVIRTTVKHMRKSIDVSISKTFERMREFEGNHEKSNEVFGTLAHLHAMKKNLEEFQAAYVKETTSK